MVRPLKNQNQLSMRILKWQLNKYTSSHYWMHSPVNLLNYVMTALAMYHTIVQFKSML